MSSAGSTGPSLGLRAAIAVAGIGFLVLLGLLGRELFSRPGAKGRVALDTSHETDPVVVPSSTSDPPPPVPTSRVVGSIAHALQPAPAAAPSTDASAGPVLDAPSSLAAMITDPRALRPTNIVPDRAKHQEEFAFEAKGPYRSMQLTKDTTNAQAWRLEGMRGPKLADLGATKEATVQKDAQGNAFATWYAIDTGPLAPAYAAQFGDDQVRIVSRAYLQANRADYPPSFTSVLDH